MRVEKTKALELRRKGKSYSMISNLLKVPKSTLSGWLKDEKWSVEIKASLNKNAKIQSAIRMRQLGKVRGKELDNAYAEAVKEAEKEFEYFVRWPLFVAGLCIYWGEGEKTSKHMIRVSNIDPGLVKVFIGFLIHVCGIPKKDIRYSLLLYPDLDEDACKQFWVSHAGLLRENFNKSARIRGRHKTKRLRYGVCNVSFSSSYLKKKIGVWLAKLPNELVKI